MENLEEEDCDIDLVKIQRYISKLVILKPWLKLDLYWSDSKSWAGSVYY